MCEGVIEIREIQCMKGGTRLSNICPAEISSTVLNQRVGLPVLQWQSIPILQQQLAADVRLMACYVASSLFAAYRHPNSTVAAAVPSSRQWRGDFIVR